MVLHRPDPRSATPLTDEDRPDPSPGPGEILVRVAMCGVCRTDLHVVRGDLPALRTPVVPGHEIVGTVERLGPQSQGFRVGETVGVPWLRGTCGACEFCLSGRENLCGSKVFTGYTVDGGYAERVTVPQGYALKVPSGEPAHIAPLLCAGIIGYRALKMALPRPGGRLGFFGFGGSAHLAVQLASRQGYETVVFSRNPSHAQLARSLGASEVVETGAPGTGPPRPVLDGAVVFAPSGEVVVEALRWAKKGATISIAGIHLSPIPPIDYDRLLFGERRLVSVESNTRADAREFLALAERLKLRTEVEVRPLSEANAALVALESGHVNGAVVLDCR